MALLSGARNHRKLDLSKKLYDRMKDLFPDEKSHLISASVLLCNTYSSIGESQQAAKVRFNRIQQLGKSIKVGLTWTEVNDEVVVRKYFK